MEIHNDTYTVYIHTNKTNGKIYVGITKRKPQDRWRNGKAYKGNPLFYAAINKYGWDGFDHQIFSSNLTESEAMNMQKFLIAELKTQNKEFGYNITGGGDTPITHNDYVKKKISNAVSGQKHPCYGKHLSQETKRKISISEKGRKKALNAGTQPKPVRCIQTNMIYQSTAEAARQCGFSHSSLTQVLTGRRKTLRGQHWEYV